MSWKCAYPFACMTKVVILLLMNGIGSWADISFDDYRCGALGGGKKCPNDLCCSPYSWCGSTPAYCGDDSSDNQKKSEDTGPSTSVSAKGSILALTESTDSSYASSSNGSDGAATSNAPSDGKDHHKHGHSAKHQKSDANSSTSVTASASLSLSSESTNITNASQSTNSSNGAATTGISSILSSAMFDQFLPDRANPTFPAKGFYTYDAFVKAANDKMFQGFGTSKDADTQKREVAAFFANVAHETQGGGYIEEINKSAYCNATCPAGKHYFGCGPLQLSWNYGYDATGKALGVDLLNNPEKISSDNVLAFKSSLWFWMSSQSPTCHEVMVNDKGFGGTIKIINGGLECGGQKSANGATEQQDRISLYEKYCKILDVSPGNALTYQRLYEDSPCFWVLIRVEAPI